jgi:hypothetical protein
MSALRGHIRFKRASSPYAFTYAMMPRLRKRGEESRRRGGRGYGRRRWRWLIALARGAAADLIEFDGAKFAHGVAFILSQ